MLTPGKQMKDFIVYGMFWTKNLLFFSKFISSLPKQLPQNQDCNRKNEKLKNGARRWIQFSQLVAPMKNMREVFVLHPVVNKKCLSVF
jgi:hypothetical protein